MAKVILSFRRLTIPEKIAKVRQIVTALTDNNNFPNANPTLTLITAGADNLEAAYTTTLANKQAVKTSITNQTISEDDLVQLVSQLARDVENRAGGDETLIISAGMDVKAGPTAPGMPDAPSGLEITIGDHDGELDLSWNPVSGVRSYEIQLSPDPPTNTTWTHAATSTKSSTTISDLTPGTRYWFRVSAITAGGQSDWSDPATKTAP
jgi:hypothetical protein